jgi:hypothetical protein
MPTCLQEIAECQYQKHRITSETQNQWKVLIKH